jgi:[ribosomal protein S5]-alanine N-acetyltransferase
LALTELPTIDLGLPGWTLRAWRAWRAGDAADLARHANDPDIGRWMSDSFPTPYTLAIAEHWVTRGHVDFGGDNWAIAFNDQAVGGCGVQQGSGPQRCVAEVGWWLGQAYWGRGVGGCVAEALVARAFENPQIARVFAPIHAGNERSMGAARSAGFTEECVQRQSAVKHGQVIDRHIFVVLRQV